MSRIESHAGAGSPPDREVARGYRLLGQGRIDEALELCERLVAAHPGHAHVLVLCVDARLASDEPLAALALVERAIAASGGNPFLKLKKGRLLVQKLRRRAGIPALVAEVAAVAGDDGQLHWQLGDLCYRTNLQADAIRHFERAHALVGDHPGLLYDMAVARFFSGDADGAEADLERTIAAAPQAAQALYLRATLRRQTPDRNHVDDLERRLRGGFRQAEDEASALYALAKELEDLGEYDGSFAALAAGAAKKRRTLRYAVADEIAAMRAICDAYDATAMAAAGKGDEGTGAIFIVGMPRSGTTLAERLLVQSGTARSAGELADIGHLVRTAAQQALEADPTLVPAAASLRADFAALGREYMRGAREAAGGSPVFIDKMTLNFLYCGAIARALPGAKIIHLVRDPMDSCYAVFKTLLFNAYHYSYDLSELAEYYIAYRDVMRHWHAVMPGRILDVRYEDLVADTAREARRMYAWCGLDWTPAALEVPAGGSVFASASAAQVREPVHARSVHSARRYGAQLAPLAAKLAAAGIRVDG